jgi:hypothetical protein
VIKLNRIYITFDHKNNKTTVIEMEKCTFNGIKKHLKKQVINGCSFQCVEEYIQKYNSSYNIDSIDWIKEKPTTDIYIKCEKQNNQKVNEIQIFYEKDVNMTRFNYNNFRGFNSNGYKTGKPNIVVETYNQFKERFLIDNKPEVFVYQESTKKNNNNRMNYNNNNNNRTNNNNRAYNNNNSNNNSNNYRRRYSSNNSSSYHNSNNQRQESNHDNNNDNNSNNNNDNASEQRRRSASFRNRDGDHMGRVSSNGNIRNASNSHLGRFESNGDIRNASGSRIGRISSDGEIRNRSNSRIGRVSSDGDIRNASGSRIGRISSDGGVYNASGSKIGDAGDMDKNQAAFMFFFNK